MSVVSGRRFIGPLGKNLLLGVNAAFQVLLLERGGKRLIP